MAFAGALPAATGAPSYLGHKLGRLPLDHRLLQSRQNGSGFGQGKPERLGPQESAFQTRHLPDDFRLARHRLHRGLDRNFHAASVKAA